MTIDLVAQDAIALAAAIRSGDVRAVDGVHLTLNRIAQVDKTLNCFTHVLADQAMQQARQIDRAIASGQEVGSLAGVPFAVKNLFDVKGLTTLSGAKINAENPPASQDATAVARLKQAGAILLGVLNMDEYAYGFVTENSHYGATHNPHDRERVAGGSSGGSAAAVASGLVPITLGSDTNGSIRVPASFCGVFGLKPTYGRLSRAGAFLFAASLDHIGPFARSVRDIATVFDVLQGADLRDPICTTRPPNLTVPKLANGINGLRMAIASDHFEQGGELEAQAAVQRVAEALEITQKICIPEAHRARGAAYLITACEGSNLHLENLKKRPHDFDPATRDRFLAGALIPGSWYVQAQRFRRWYRDRVLECFQDVDLIIAPTTPCVAPKLGQLTMMLNGVEVKTRPNLGLYTQPLSFIGLPILSIPVCQPNSLPIGVQLIAAPYQEALLLQTAAALEAKGIISAPIAGNYSSQRAD